MDTEEGTTTVARGGGSRQALRLLVDHEPERRTLPRFDCATKPVGGARYRADQSWAEETRDSCPAVSSQYDGIFPTRGDRSDHRCTALTQWTR